MRRGYATLAGVVLKFGLATKVPRVADSVAVLREVTALKPRRETFLPIGGERSVVLEKHITCQMHSRVAQARKIRLDLFWLWPRPHNGCAV